MANSFLDRTGLQKLINKIRQIVKKSDNIYGFANDDINTYTGKAIVTKVTEMISGQVGGYLGNKTPAQINAGGSWKSGDWATMSQSGTINNTYSGNFPVVAGDEIYWVVGGGWQLKAGQYVKKQGDSMNGSLTMDGSGSAIRVTIQTDSDKNRLAIVANGNNTATIKAAGYDSVVWENLDTTPSVKFNSGVTFNRGLVGNLTGNVTGNLNGSATYANEAGTADNVNNVSVNGLVQGHLYEVIFF